MRVLAGDVGGTNARLAVVDVESGAASIVVERDYPSASADGLHAIVRRFEGDVRIPVPTRGCVAIAGPVVDGRVQVTNLPWAVDAAALRAKLGMELFGVVNDFHAVGMGLALMGPPDLVVLQRGEPVEHGPVGYLGPGTGLGVGFRMWDGARYRVYESEGGHVDFAPRTAAQDGLRDFLRTRYGRASNERVLCGAGLADIYRFLATRPGADRGPGVDAEFARDDPAAVVAAHALAGDDGVCVRALELFVSVLGAVAGNLALTAVATGGVYIAGGIAPRIISAMKEATFMDAFHDQGRLSPLVAKMPVVVVANTKVGLLGAAWSAAQG